MSLTAALLAGAMSAPVHAKGFTHSWPQGETLHYQVQGFVWAPRVLRFWATQNIDARVIEYQVLLLLECENVDVGKTIDMTCGVHHAQFGGLAWEGEQNKLDDIFDEFGDVLESARVEIVWKPNGQVKTVDLENIDKDNDRHARLHEDLRLLMQRAFAGLEVTTPKNGDVSKSWRQKGSPLLMRLPTRYGTNGGMLLEHQVVEMDDDIAKVQSWGQATVNSLVDAQVTEGMSTQTDSLSSTGDVNMFVSGGAEFDTSRGLLVKSEFQVQGALTTASSGVGSGKYIDQFFMVELLPNFDDVDARIAAAEAAAEGVDSEVDQAAQDAVREAFGRPASEGVDAEEPAEGEGAEPAEGEGAEPAVEEPAAEKDAERQSGE